MQLLYAIVIYSAVALAAAYRAAVVQHQVVQSSNASDTIAANIAKYIAAIADASSQGADIVVLPEFGLGISTGSCNSTRDVTPFCEPMPYSNGTSPCQLDTAGATPIQTQASCAAAANKMWISINSCEAAPEGNYNTQIVYDAQGNFVTKYRKSHPFYSKCFLTPQQPDLVTFSATALNPRPFGIFTCFDIMFPTPGPALVKQYGIRQFTYSAAIPLVGSAAQELWSLTYGSTLIGSNLQDGQSGIYVNGTRITPVPASGVDVVLVADL